MQQPRIVAMGGGHGLGTTLAAITEHIPGIRPVGIVTTFDNGGSSGRLRELLGIQAVGDLGVNLLATSEHQIAAVRFGHQRFGEGACLDDTKAEAIIMAEAFGMSDPVAQDMFNGVVDITAHLLRKGDTLQGHSLRNIWLAYLALNSTNLTEASKTAGKAWGSRADVLPVTHHIAELVMEADHHTYYGEDQIDQTDVRDVLGAQITLDRPVDINRDARNAITSASHLIVAPGSLMTSVLASLAPDEVREAIRDMPYQSKFIFVPSLVHDKTTHDETAQVVGVTHLKAKLESHTRRVFDRVILHSGADSLRNPITRPHHLALIGTAAVHAGLVAESKAGPLTSADDKVALKGLRGETFHDRERLGELLRNIIFPKMYKVIS